MHASDRRSTHSIVTPALVLSVFALLGLAAPSALAQTATVPPPVTSAAAAPTGLAAGFGQQGQLVVSSELAFGLHRIDGGAVHLFLRPALDYFIAQNISVGGMVILNYSNPPGAAPTQTDIWLGARAGYNLLLTDAISFWGTLAFLYQNPAGDTGSNVRARVFAPFLFHLVPHLFVGVGPYFEQGMSESFTNFGLESLVGGYF